MSDKQPVEPGHPHAPIGRTDVNAARMTADTQRRWDEIRQMREQVMSRQEQIIQQTSADVRRHVERMRHVRQSIVAPEPARPAPKAEAAPKPPSEPLKPIPNGPRFDFDSRRAAWEQRRREQAEKRRADIERAQAPYLEQRRLLEEKRRQALLDQEAQRSKPRVGAHQTPPPTATPVPSAQPEPDVIDVVDDIDVEPAVIDDPRARISIEVAPEIVRPSLPYQHTLFPDDLD